MILSCNRECLDRIVTRTMVDRQSFGRVTDHLYNKSRVKTRILSNLMGRTIILSKDAERNKTDNPTADYVTPPDTK